MSIHLIAVDNLQHFKAIGAHVSQIEIQIHDFMAHRRVVQQRLISFRGRSQGSLGLFFFNDLADQFGEGAQQLLGEIDDESGAGCVGVSDLSQRFRMEAEQIRQRRQFIRISGRIAVTDIIAFFT